MTILIVIAIGLVGFGLGYGSGYVAGRIEGEATAWGEIYDDLVS